MILFIDTRVIKIRLIQMYPQYYITEEKGTVSLLNIVC